MTTIKSISDRINNKLIKTGVRCKLSHTDKTGEYTNNWVTETIKTNLNLST